MAGLRDLHRFGAALDHGTEELHRRGAEHGILHSDGHEAFARPVLRPEFARGERGFDPFGGKRRQRLALLLQHHKLREAADAALVALVGEGRVIGRHLRIRQNRRCALHQVADVQIRLRAGVGAPHGEAFRRLLAGGKPGVHDDKARIALRRRQRQGEAEEPAPVLHDETDVPEIKPLDKGEKGVPVEMIGVNIIVDRLVRPAEAEHVDRDGAMPGAGEDGDHLAEEVGPGGLAMDAKERDLRVRRPLVRIMHAKSLIALEPLDITRRKGPAGKLRETIVRGPQGFDGHECLRLPRRHPRARRRRGLLRDAATRWFFIARDFM